MDAVEEKTRIQNCGLVYHENQLSGRRWVGPPTPNSSDASVRVKILPLTQIKPKAGIEINALDGEKYLLEESASDWFAVVSPKGVRLIQ